MSASISWLLFSKCLEPASTPLPKIDGLAEGSSTLLAIVLSHGHRDHWGLIPKVNSQIPLVMGRATESIIRAAVDFVPDAVKLNAAQYHEHGKCCIEPRISERCWPGSSQHLQEEEK
jgi:mRNA degradation ribonuclease J1/J2